MTTKTLPEATVVAELKHEILLRKLVVNMNTHLIVKWSLYSWMGQVSNVRYAWEVENGESLTPVGKGGSRPPPL